MKKIVLYLKEMPENGGSYQFWLAMIKALSQLDWKQYQLTVYSSQNYWQPIVKKYYMNFKIIDKDMNMLQRICKEILPNIIPIKILRKISHFCNPIVKQLRKDKMDKADIWIAQTSKIGGTLLGIPTIIPIFDLMHRFYPELSEISSSYQGRENIYRQECRRAAMILVDSRIGFEHVVQFYGKSVKYLSDKIRILPFTPPDYIYEGIEREVRQERIFDKYIFYPAQFWTHKNHKRLISSIGMLKERGIIVNLILSGAEQGNRRQMQSLITELMLDEQIKILGYVTNEEMVYLYKNARALIMPSLFGPTNIPPLEAFELGCPVAVSNIFGMPEQVGDAGLLFNPFSEEDIANCVAELWKNDELCRKLMERGKEKTRLWGQKQFAETLIKYIEEFC